MKLPARSVAWLLPLLLTACFHKSNSTQVQPPLALPLRTCRRPSRCLRTTDLPPPVVTVPSQTPPPSANASAQPQPVPKPPVKHKKPPAAPAQQASSGSPASAPSVSSPPATPTTSSARRGLHRRHRAQPERHRRKLNDQELKTAAQIREYLKQATAALATGDSRVPAPWWQGQGPARRAQPVARRLLIRTGFAASMRPRLPAPRIMASARRLRAPNHMRREDNQQHGIAACLSTPVRLFSPGISLIPGVPLMARLSDLSSSLATTTVSGAQRHHPGIGAIVQIGFPLIDDPRERRSSCRYSAPHRRCASPWGRLQRQPQVLILHLRNIRHAAAQRRQQRRKCARGSRRGQSRNPGCAGRKAGERRSLDGNSACPNASSPLPVAQMQQHLVQFPESEEFRSRLASANPVTGRIASSRRQTGQGRWRTGNWIPGPKPAGYR